MPLQQTGVALVAQNEQGFLSAMTRAESAVNSFVKTAGGATGGLKSFSLGTMAIASAIGNIAGNLITGAISKIGEIGSTAVMSAAKIQNLTLSLESLSAKELVANGVATDMNSALAQAAPIAQDLLKRIRDLSIASPFEYQDVVRVFQLNMAFGQSSDMSLKLTKSITDMAAAMGNGGEMIERIAYNFSQMILVGKVSARDIRDLALAGVDLSRVLREELGMSVDDVNAALESGKITMQDVSEAFVSYADKNFGNAAQRMSRTFTGLMSSFKDLFFFSSIDILGPSLDIVSTALGGVLDRAMALVNSGALQKIGYVFGLLTEKAFSAVDGITSAFGGLFDKLGITIGQGVPKVTSGIDLMNTAISVPIEDTIDKAFEWGANIVVQLANGIIQAASAALTMAMNFLGGLLSGFLAPGSPPKVAPNIDKWGAAAMTEYLKGFTEGDFTVLKAVQQPLQDVFNMMTSLGKMTEKEAGSIYANISKELAQGLKSGNLSEKVYGDIAKAGDKWGKEIADLAKKQFALSVATDAVATAENTLKQARATQSSALAKVSKGIREYNDMLRAGASKDQLSAKQKEINAQKSIANEAGKQITQAETDLELAKAKVDLLSQQAKLQEELLRQLIEISRQQIVSPPEKEKEKEKGKGGAGEGAKKPGLGGGITLPKVGGGAGFKANLKKIFDDAFAQIGVSWDTAMSPLRAKFESMKGMILAAVTDIQSRVKETLFPLQRFWAENGAQIQAIVSRVVNSVAENIGYLVGTVFKWLLEKAQEVSTWIMKNGDEITNAMDLVGKIVEWVAKAVRESWAVIGSILDLIITGILGMVSIVLNIIQGDWSEAWQVAKDTGVKMLQQLVQLGLNFFANALKLFGINISTNLNEIAETGRTWGEKIRTIIVNAWNYIKTDTLAKLGEWKNIANQLFQQLIIGAGEKAQAIQNKAAEIINGAKNAISNLIGGFTSVGGQIMQGLINGIINQTSLVANAIKQAIQNAIDAAKKALGIGSPSKVFMKFGQQSLQGYGIGAQRESRDTSASLLRSIQSVIQPVASGAPVYSYNNTKTANLNLGGVNVNNGMEEAVLFAKFRQFLASEL